MDREVLRGIPLHHALRWPRAWIQPALFRQSHRSGQIYEASMVVEDFDQFLSHSWKTPGYQKLLAFLLQIGWPHGCLGWSIATAIVLLIRLMNLVETPWRMCFTIAGKEFMLQSNPCLLLAGALGQLLGLACSPYLQRKKTMCFLDIACVHQGDEELLRRGISNIGGCLSVSKELRVLYHPTYFKSSPELETGVIHYGVAEVSHAHHTECGPSACTRRTRS